MTWFTPDQVEISYRRGENRLYQWLAERLHFVFMAVACLFLYGLARFTHSYFLSGHFHYFFVGAFVLVRFYRRVIQALLILSLVAVFIPKRWQVWFQFYVTITISMLAAPTIYKHTSPTTLGFGMLVMPFVLISSWLYLKSNVGTDKKWTSTIIYSLFFWSLTAVVSYWLWSHSYHSQLKRFWQFKIQFIWISMLVLVWHQKITQEETIYAFIPMNSLRGVLWPYDFGWEENLAKRRKIWWNGYCNLLLGYSVLLGRMWLEKGPLLAFRNVEPLRISGHVLTILSDVGALNLVSGTARLFGYSVRDATNFVFFARTPADIWRRSSTYNYLFVLRCVYMPLFRVWRNFFFVSFISFLVFFINHHGVWSFLDLGLHLTNIVPIQSKFKLFKLTIYSLHFLFIFFLLYFTRRWWFFRWRDMDKPRVAWASVVLTHILRVMARALSYSIAWHWFH